MNSANCAICAPWVLPDADATLNDPATLAQFDPPVVVQLSVVDAVPSFVEECPSPEVIDKSMRAVCPLPIPFFCPEQDIISMQNSLELDVTVTVGAASVPVLVALALKVVVVSPPVALIAS